MRSLVCTVMLLLLCAVPSWTQGEPELDGVKHVFQDPLLDHMAGSWKLTGTIVGRKANHQVDAEWVLNHQFLRIHEKENATSDGSSVPYEAIVMVGYDNASERYVAHWMDVGGGRYSETLGYGTRVGDEIRFVFEYPDGPFHTAFRWDAKTQQWQWLMRARNNSGWSNFADLTLAAEKKM